MTTPISLQYRCQLPGGSKTGLPVFNDLSTTRTGPLTARVGLGRLLTLARVIGDPIQVVIENASDLADPVDQQAVAALLARSGSELIIAGTPVKPDKATCAVLGELQQLAQSIAWFAPERPDGDEDAAGRKADLHTAVQALVVGLQLRPPQVAALLNEALSWRSRSGSTKGFTRQSISHYVSGQEPPSLRVSTQAMPADLNLPGQGSGALMVAGISVAFVLSVSVTHPDALTGAQRVVLEEIVRRSGGAFTGHITAEPTAKERRQLDQVLDFVLDVVQGAFLNRPHPARDLAAAQRFAKSRQRRQHKAVAAELDAAGYLTASTYGKWSTSSVSDLLKPPPPQAEPINTEPTSP